MNHAVVVERFHALDATRAFALLLGVVFHVAWGFIPSNASTPITDVSANIGFDYFFYTAHMFRMQVFFLIAGFFARMLYHRRGPSQFIKNRGVRIAVPLVVAWIILAPLIILTWVWGANRSGQNLSEVPLTLILKLMGMGLLLLPRSSGGLFSLGHLWFLYYLLWMYAVALVARAIAVRVVPAQSQFKQRVDSIISFCVKSRWSVIWLGLATGLAMWRMDGWNGVDTPVRQYAPSAPVLSLYGLFFGFGWLLHRQTDLLRVFIRGWRWQLGAGVALSVVLFSVYDRLDEANTRVMIGGTYPELSPQQIADWPGFLSRLNSIAGNAESEPLAKNLWNRISPGDQARIEQLSDEPPIDLRVGVCKSLNASLVYPELFEPAEFDAAGNPILIARRPLDAAETKRVTLQNRRRLEQLFDGDLRSDPKTLPGYWTIKLFYSLGYCVAMWCLVFATLGFFQQWCAHYSRVWRYVADSSYWVYLAHIPLVIWMHVWIAPLPWPGWIKFLVLNLVAFTVLYASYHYLVRSTFIGRVLNGRRYPLVAFPWSSPRQEQSAVVAG